MYEKSKSAGHRYTYADIKNKFVIAKGLLVNNYKEARNLLIELQQLIKNADLSKSERLEFHEKIQDCFNDIQKKITKEQIDFENEASNNFFNLNPKILQATERVNYSENHRETWDYLIEIQNEFKGIKLRKEHREALYSQLQQAFELLKQKIAEQKVKIENDNKHNYELIITKIMHISEKISDNNDIIQAKEELISIQTEIKNINFTRNQKDILYNLIQECFEKINFIKLESEKSKNEKSTKNYADLLENIDEILNELKINLDKNIKEKIIFVQNQVRNADLHGERRSELLEKLQKAYSQVNQKLNNERDNFVKEASENYLKLKTLVEKGLKQANVSHEYKATREFLKKIQSEFKGIRMIKEEREYLYSKLQQAFEILGQRVDEYFRTKKKNWAVQMQYKLSELDIEVHQLKKVIELDNEKLKELEDHRDILINSGKQSTILTGVAARIESIKREILTKKERIVECEEIHKELQRKIGDDQQDNI